jgi:hypothetical protein
MIVPRKDCAKEWKERKGKDRRRMRRKEGRKERSESGEERTNRGKEGGTGGMEEREGKKRISTSIHRCSRLLCCRWEPTLSHCTIIVTLPLCGMKEGRAG